MESMNNVDNTLIHISHLHPLKLVASPEPKPICHACNMLCADQSYGCIHCHYFLHITCATTGQSMDHPSHPAHTLKLELTPPYSHGHYGCDACGVDGSSFSLRCRECSYDLHLPCAGIPHKVNHRSHHHPLILVFKNPYPSNMGASCDLCKNYIDVNKWFYLCTSCDFGGLQPLHAPSHGAAQLVNEMDNLLELQMRVDMQRMCANLGDTFRNYRAGY